MYRQLAPTYYAGIERSGRPFGAIRITTVLSSFRSTGFRRLWDKMRRVPDELGKNYEVEWVIGPDPNALVDHDDLYDGPFIEGAVDGPDKDPGEAEQWLDHVFGGFIESPCIPGETLHIVPYDVSRFGPANEWFSRALAAIQEIHSD